MKYSFIQLQKTRGSSALLNQVRMTQGGTLNLRGILENDDAKNTNFVTLL